MFLAPFIRKSLEKSTKVKDEVPTHIKEYAKIADMAYKPREERRKIAKAEGYYIIKQGTDFITVMLQNGKVVLSHRGTHDVDDVVTDIELLHGRLVHTPRYKRARRITKEIIKRFGEDNVVLASHSLGGEINRLLAVEFGIESHSFNAASPPSHVLGRIVEKIIPAGGDKKKPIQHVHQIVGDPLSQLSVFGGINEAIHLYKAKNRSNPHTIANFY